MNGSAFGTSGQGSLAASVPPGDTRTQRLTIAGAVLLLAYPAAAAAGASELVLNVVFTLLTATLPPLAVWAYFRAPSALRRVCALLAAGGTLWLIGTLLWEYDYLTHGQTVPPPLGPWDGIFLVAYVFALAAVLVGLRSAISLRDAALDASIILAGALALGAALIGHDLDDGISATSLGTLVRPSLAILMLTLLVSVALGDWEGIPLSVALIGVGQGCLALGGLVYSHDVVQGAYVNLGWAGLGLASAAALSMLAAGVIILGLDRPLRLPASWIPHHPLGSRVVLLAALAALGTTVGASYYGHAVGNRATLVVGLTASVWIGTAMAFRARSSIREVEAAYGALERAHLSLERARDELAAANDELAGANVELRCVHTALEDLLVIADERTDGALRDLIADAGEDLAEMLSRYRARERGEEEPDG